MFHSLKSYLSYLLESTNQYGVHSPFVYELLTVGLKAKISPSDQRVLSKFRRTLRSDEQVIQVKDFGAGSRVFTGSARRVRQIAKTAGISPSHSNKLYRIVKHFQPSNILELGTSLGLATAALSVAAPKANIDTLEGCPQTAGVARSMFDAFGLSNIELHVGEFDETLPQLLAAKNYDLIFFDGNHQRQATLLYFNLCLKAVNPGSVFIFDDIHWSQEMEEAWNEIRQHERVTLSIDAFQWGMVFFHSGREKEHFVLRL